MFEFCHVEKTKINKKEAGIGLFFEKIWNNILDIFESGKPNLASFPIHFSSLFKDSLLKVVFQHHPLDSK